MPITDLAELHALSVELRGDVRLALVLQSAIDALEFTAYTLVEARETCARIAERLELYDNPGSTFAASIRALESAPLPGSPSLGVLRATE